MPLMPLTREVAEKDVQLTVIYSLLESTPVGTLCFIPTEHCGTDETGDGNSCDIPFWYAGKKYYNCTLTSSFTKRNKKPWCAILKTEPTKYEYSLSEWGDCRQECNEEGNF